MMAFFKRLAPVAGRLRWVGVWLVPAWLAWGFFQPVGGFDFLKWDDWLYVANHPVYAGGWSGVNIQFCFLANLMFAEPSVDGWVPVTALSRLLDYEIHGGNPGGHHLTGLWLHVGNTLLATLVAWRVFRLGWWSVLATGCLAAVAVPGVEVVGWLSARKDLLAITGCWLTLLAYDHFLRRPAQGRWLLATVAYAICLLAKPALTLLPIFLVLLDWADWARGAKVGAQPPGFRWLALAFAAKWPFLLASGVAGGLAWVVQQELGAFQPTIDLGQRLLLAGGAIGWYAARFIDPWFPLIFHPASELALTPGAVAAIIGSLLIAGIGVAAVWKGRILVALGVGFAFCTLLPSGMLALGQQMTPDRYGTLPTIGWWLVLLGVVGGLPVRSWLKILPVGIVMVSHALSTALALPAWHATQPVFAQVLAKYGPQPVALLLIATDLHDAGRLTAAKPLYESAIRLLPPGSPDALPAWKNLWLLHRTRGDEAAAAYYYRRYERLLTAPVDKMSPIPDGKDVP